MQETIVNLISEYGYVGIAFLIFVENIFPPIPSEVVLVFGGFMAAHTQMNVPTVVLFATCGSTAGAAVLYMIGRILKRERIKKLFSSRFGKVMHLNPDDVDKAEIWFAKYEYKAVLICRCIPVVRSLISIPAGMAQMRPVPFFALTIIGTIFWNSILVYIGAWAKGAWETSIQYIGWYSKAALVVLAIAAVGFVCYKIRSKKREK